MSKTSQFDKALDQYFAKLELDEKGGQWRICRFSGEKFYVRPEDVEFYKKIRVPLPTLSPLERRRRRLAAHNSYNLFRGNSAFTGKPIVTIYPPGSLYKVFEYSIWNSDKWDSLNFAHTFAASNSFFEQFYQFQLEVPRPNLISDPSNINSDYTNVSKGLKNCYIVFDQNGGENLYYHQCCLNDKNCIECWALDDSDTCYECKIGKKLFRCFFCEQSRNCMESMFLWNCRNCEHCFMSANLRNKKYYFRNEYMGKEEYEKQIRDIYLGDFNQLLELKLEFAEIKKNAVRKPSWNEKSVNAFGDYIWTSKNIYFSLYIEDSENLAYCEGLSATRDSYDCLGGSQNELCYEVSNISSENNYGCKFSLHIDNSREVEYSQLCYNSRNCFGCIGLSDKQFCIFNTQYSEEKYWRVVDEIKSRMLMQGEYGEFFPPQYLPFPYRTTILMSFPGFEDFENAERYGYDARRIEETIDIIEGSMIKARDLPADIKDIGDDILEKVVYDEPNNKKFRIIKPELDFYRIHHLPLPREHPSVRMERWRKEIGLKTAFYGRTCPRCGKKFESTYAPDAPEKNIYCEACYLAEIG